jgi:hypothetical protein
MARWLMLFLRGLPIVVFGNFVFVGTAQADDEYTYNKPVYFDVRLDWCLRWGQDCGEPAAMAFCNRKQYSRVVAFSSEKAEPTRVFSTQQICRGSNCAAFSSITCSDFFPNNQVFVNPAARDIRLDVCLTYGRDCGQPVADEFCRQSGMGSPIAFYPDPVPGHSPTRTIGSGEECRGTHCTGFQMIICGRVPAKPTVNFKPSRKLQKYILEK